MRLLHENKLSLAQASKRLPRGKGDRPIAPQTLARWINAGIKTRQGVVKLEAFRLGRLWYTSVEALERFVARQTEVEIDDSHPRRDAELAAIFGE